MARRKNPFGIEPIKIKPLDLDFGLYKRAKRDSRRAFTITQKKEIWVQQKGKCAICHKKLDPRTVEYMTMGKHGLLVVQHRLKMEGHCALIVIN